MPLPPNIQQWKDGYRARLQVRGRRRVGPLRKEVKHAIRDRDRMRAEAAAPTAEADWRLDEALERELIDAETRGAGARTVAAHRTTVRAILDVFDGAVRLGAIGRAELEEYASRAIQAGRQAVTVAQKDFPLLRRAWRLAGATWPQPRAPRVNRPQMPYFAIDEIPALLDRVRAMPSRNAARCEAAILVLVTTGMRAEELGRLQASDVDLRRGVVRIVNFKRGRMVHERPITDAGRPGFEWLLEHPDEGAEEGRLWRYDLRPKDLLMRAQATLKEPRLHCRALRHTYGTALHAAGVPLRVAMEAMGHSTYGAHLRYLHAADEHVRDAIHRVSSALRTAGGTPPEQQGDAGTSP